MIAAGNLLNVWSLEEWMVGHNYAFYWYRLLIRNNVKPEWIHEWMNKWMKNTRTK